MLDLPAGATGPAQALLARLTSPATPPLGHAWQESLVPDDEPLIEDDPSATLEDLFIPEDLRGKSESSTELVLSDVALPVSVIPLELNSKVEYFIDYFQTKGRPA